MKTDLFQSCGHCWVFQICWCIECSTFTASSFRIWNISTGISSLSPLWWQKKKTAIHFYVNLFPRNMFWILSGIAKIKGIAFDPILFHFIEPSSVLCMCGLWKWQMDIFFTVPHIIPIVYVWRFLSVYKWNPRSLGTLNKTWGEKLAPGAHWPPCTESLLLLYISPLRCLFCSKQISYQLILFCSKAELV